MRIHFSSVWQMMKEKGIFTDISLIFRERKALSPSPQEGWATFPCPQYKKGWGSGCLIFLLSTVDIGPASYKKVNTLKPQLKRAGGPGKDPRGQQSPKRGRKTLLSWGGLTYGLFAHYSLPPSFPYL